MKNLFRFGIYASLTFVLFFAKATITFAQYTATSQVIPSIETTAMKLIDETFALRTGRYVDVDTLFDEDAGQKAYFAYEFIPHNDSITIKVTNWSYIAWAHLDSGLRIIVYPYANKQIDMYELNVELYRGKPQSVELSFNGGSYRYQPFPCVMWKRVGNDYSVLHICKHGEPDKTGLAPIHEEVTEEKFLELLNTFFSFLKKKS